MLFDLNFFILIILFLFLYQKSARHRVQFIFEPRKARRAPKTKIILCIYLYKFYFSPIFLLSTNILPTSVFYIRHSQEEIKCSLTYLLLRKMFRLSQEWFSLEQSDFKVIPVFPKTSNIKLNWNNFMIYGAICLRSDRVRCPTFSYNSANQ